MKYQKLVILPLLFISVHVLYIGCCKCDPVSNKYFKISGWTLKETSDSLPDLAATVDTIPVRDSFVAAQSAVLYDYIAKQHSQLLPTLAGVAYACKCVEFRNLGMKYNIDSFTILSNKTYDGILAGKNVGTKFSCLLSWTDTTYFQPRTARLSLLQAKDTINRYRNFTDIKFIGRNYHSADSCFRFSYNLYSNNDSVSSNSGKVIKFKR